MPPARFFEIVGGGGQSINRAIPDIAFAIAIKIDSIRGVGCGDKLRMSHGASPGSVHLTGADITMLQDAQGGQKLLATKAAAAAVAIGKGWRETG